MIAVGVGIAPMIHTLRAIFKHRDRQLHRLQHDTDSTDHHRQMFRIQVKLLYGVVSSANSLFSAQSLSRSIPETFHLL